MGKVKSYTFSKIKGGFRVQGAGCRVPGAGVAIAGFGA